MDCKQHNKWEDFETAVSELRDRHKKEEGVGGYISPLLFRGQANGADWKLKTTLERFTAKQYSGRNYLKLMLAVKPIIESYTGKDWNIPNISPWRKELDSERPPPFPEFMVYLRHHGFPSPLLDWTRSPYIAAYFAFRNVNPDKIKNVAIYSYVEYTGYGKYRKGFEPYITSIGPYIKTHKRHHLQQCEYTVCRKPNANSDTDYYYDLHDDALDIQRNGQDICAKHLIPATEKNKVMDTLQVMNINDFSLFDTEDALIQMLALQEVDDKK